MLIQKASCLGLRRHIKDMGCVLSAVEDFKWTLDTFWPVVVVGRLLLLLFWARLQWEEDGG
jgi:hypothetical protein